MIRRASRRPARPVVRAQVPPEVRDDRRRVGAAPPQSRRGEGAPGGEADEGQSRHGRAEAPTLVRDPARTQGAQGGEVAQIRSVPGGEDHRVDRLGGAVGPGHAVCGVAREERAAD
jgi:hypothetical protein